MKNRSKRNLCIDCGKCCLDTEMILSENDIISIIEQSRLTLKREEIVKLNTDGFYHIRNNNGHCIFLDFHTKLCKIYDSRPKGCQFYPLIFDLEKNRCIYDLECPRRVKFQLSNKKEKSKCEKLRYFLLKEIGIVL